MGGEGRVVAAAVLRVEHERHVEHAGLQGGVLAVRAQDAQDVLRRRKLWVGRVDIEALPLVVVVVGLVAVDRQQREERDKLEALAQHVGDADVVGAVVVGIEGEHAAREGVHHVAARRLHDDVAHKAGRKRAVTGEQGREILQLPFAGKLPEEQQVDGFLETKPLFADESGDEVLDVDAVVEELALTGDGRTALVHHAGLDFGDLGESRKHALAVDVAQAAFHVQFLIQRGVNGAALPAELGKVQYFLRNLGIRVVGRHVSHSLSVPLYVFIDLMNHLIIPKNCGQFVSKL